MNIMEYPQDATQDIDSQSILLSATSDDGKGQGQHVFHLLVGQDQGSDQLNPIGLGNLSADDVADVFRGLDMSSLGVTSAWDTRDIFSHGDGPGGDVFHARQKSSECLNTFATKDLAPKKTKDKRNRRKVGKLGSGDSFDGVQRMGDVDDMRQGVDGPGDTNDTNDKVKRTVYVADVHHQVSESQLAKFFNGCGPIVDYRICGDTNTVLRFAFIEFHSVHSAKEAIKLTGSVLGESAIRVSPSKTAIIPVKDQFLPRSERERELVARTVYVANIHQTVERDVLRQFFQMVCGQVSKIRLLGDAQHDTKIAFVEFASKDSTAAALRCTGAMLGPLAIRVSPSKTPVRTDARRRAASEQAHIPTDAATAAAKLTNQMRQTLRQSGGRGTQRKNTNGKNTNPTSSVRPRSGDDGQGEVEASPTIISLLEGILSD
jgi:RNA recognition motif-containing protein